MDESTDYRVSHAEMEKSILISFKSTIVRLFIRTIKFKVDVLIFIH